VQVMANCRTKVRWESKAKSRFTPFANSNCSFSVMISLCLLGIRLKFLCVRILFLKSNIQINGLAVQNREGTSLLTRQRDTGCRSVASRSRLCNTVCFDFLQIGAKTQN
jgi:hypothetical protein